MKKVKVAINESEKYKDSNRIQNGFLLLSSDAEKQVYVRNGITVVVPKQTLSEQKCSEIESQGVYIVDINDINDFVKYANSLLPKSKSRQK